MRTLTTKRSRSTERRARAVLNTRSLTIVSRACAVSRGHTKPGRHSQSHSQPGIRLRLEKHCTGMPALQLGPQHATARATHPPTGNSMLNMNSAAAQMETPASGELPPEGHAARHTPPRTRQTPATCVHGARSCCSAPGQLQLTSKKQAALRASVQGRDVQPRWRSLTWDGVSCFLSTMAARRTCHNRMVWDRMGSSTPARTRPPGEVVRIAPSGQDRTRRRLSGHGPTWQL